VTTASESYNLSQVAALWPVCFLLLLLLLQRFSPGSTRLLDSWRIRGRCRGRVRGRALQDQETLVPSRQKGSMCTFDAIPCARRISCIEDTCASICTRTHARTRTHTHQRTFDLIPCAFRISCHIYIYIKNIYIYIYIYIKIPNAIRELIHACLFLPYIYEYITHTHTSIIHTMQTYLDMPHTYNTHITRARANTHTHARA